MRYEPGMQIFFDVIGKGTTIIFRGRVFSLSGPFESQDAAIAAGEQKCRELGWDDQAAHRTETSADN